MLVLSIKIPGGGFGSLLGVTNIALVLSRLSTNLLAWHQVEKVSRLLLND